MAEAAKCQICKEEKDHKMYNNKYDAKQLVGDAKLKLTRQVDNPHWRIPKTLLTLLKSQPHAKSEVDRRGMLGCLLFKSTGDPNKD